MSPIYKFLSRADRYCSLSRPSLPLHQTPLLPHGDGALLLSQSLLSCHPDGSSSNRLLLAVFTLLSQRRTLSSSVMSSIFLPMLRFAFLCPVRCGVHWTLSALHILSALASLPLLLTCSFHSFFPHKPFRLRLSQYSAHIARSPSFTFTQSPQTPLSPCPILMDRLSSSIHLCHGLEERCLRTMLLTQVDKGAVIILCPSACAATLFGKKVLVLCDLLRHVLFSQQRRNTRLCTGSCRSNR